MYSRVSSAQLDAKFTPGVKIVSCCRFVLLTCEAGFAQVGDHLYPCLSFVMQFAQAFGSAETSLFFEESANGMWLRAEHFFSVTFSVAMSSTLAFAFELLRIRLF